jgi:hypothetical protein
MVEVKEVKELKEFKVEFKEITTYVGSIKANSLERAKEVVCSRGHLLPEHFEAVQGETKIVFIEEVKDGYKKS